LQDDKQRPHHKHDGQQQIGLWPAHSNALHARGRLLIRNQYLNGPA
jgi:hypothetical protein